MGGEKACGTYGEGGSRKGESIWNINKEFREKKRANHPTELMEPGGTADGRTGGAEEGFQPQWKRT